MVLFHFSHFRFSQQAHAFETCIHLIVSFPYYFFRRSLIALTGALSDMVSFE